MTASPAPPEPLATYTVLLERDGDGAIVARCKELDGAISDGPTERDALRNVREAIELYLESLGRPAEFNLTAMYG